MTPALAGSPAAIVVAAILGLVFGSFANVCIHRLPQRRSVVWPGSSCPSCNGPIVWHDNIPVVSWVLLGGRCRRCSATIPGQYPVVEAVGALLLVALSFQHGIGIRWAALSYLAISVLILVPIDFQHGILPDKVTLTGIAVGLLASPFTAEPGILGSLVGAAAGALVPYAVRAIYIVYATARARAVGAGAPEPPAEGGDAGAGDARPHAPDLAETSARAMAEEPGEHEDLDEEEHADERREGMGLGDVKMLAMVGAFLGAPQVVLTMLLGSVIGTIIVVPLVLAGRRSMKTPVPFGPFLGVAAIVVMLWGSQILEWYGALVFAGGN